MKINIYIYYNKYSCYTFTYINHYCKTQWSSFILNFGNNSHIILSWQIFFNLMQHYVAFRLLCTSYSKIGSRSQKITQFTQRQSILFSRMNWTGTSFCFCSIFISDLTISRRKSIWVNFSLDFLRIRQAGTTPIFSVLMKNNHHHCFVRIFGR